MSGPNVLEFIAAPDPVTAARACGVPDSIPVAAPDQVHGTRCIVLSAPDPDVALDALPAADAAVFHGRALALTVRTADCVPVLLWGAGWVGVIHAGWRGCAGGVVPEVLAVLAGQGVDVAALNARIGPAACGACYEVGPEVVEALERQGPRVFRQPGRGDRSFVDLRAQTRAQLLAGGLRASNIEQHPDCTIHDADWPSWRRDGPAAGRLYGVIWGPP